MANTLVSDILIPEVWDDYFIEMTAEKSDLIDSGIVVRDPAFDVLAQRGGNMIDLPFFTDLTGSSSVLSDSVPLVPGKIGTAQDRCRLHVRGNARSVNDLSGALAGADPLNAIMQLIHRWWMRDEQAMLLSTLLGVFEDNKDNDSGDLILTHGAEATGDIVAWNGSSPTVMCPEAIIDGQALLGDAQDRFTAIMMHSKCYTDLLKQELIDFERPSGSASSLPFYIGKRIIVNDNCPRRDGSTSGTNTIYQSFLFAEGAIGRGEGRAPVPSELERSALASDTYFITRRHFILHPRGVAWQNSSIDGDVTGGGPTNDELEEAAQWDRVYEKKNLRFAMIETN
jgi:hypothetical protein